MRRAWVHLVAIVVGVPLAFFFVFAPLFTDSPAGWLHPERLASYGLSFGVYALAGFLVGLLRSRDPWVPAALALAGAALAVLYALREPGVALLAFLYVLLAAAGGALGVWLAGLRSRRGRSR